MPEVPAYVPAYVFTRGGLVESVHHAGFAMVDACGRLLAAAGPVAAAVFMRSSAKPLQVLPLLVEAQRRGAALEDEAIAIMVASHSGTPRHVELLARMHQHWGLGPDLLQCGVHPPLDRASAQALRDAGQEPTPFHHNCSGKHTGFLLLARWLHAPLETYLDPMHPVQQRVRQVVAHMAGLPVQALVVGTDGCSAPNFAPPLYHAAWAWARLVDPRGLDPDLQQAAKQVVRAMVRYPFLVAGPGRFDTLVMEAMAGRVVAKGGAEGYQALGIPPGVLGPVGVGIVLKVADGDRRRRVAGALALHILQELGLYQPEAHPDLAQAFGPRLPVFNVRGDVQVGEGYPLWSVPRPQWPPAPAGPARQTPGCNAGPRSGAEAAERRNTGESGPAGG